MKISGTTFSRSALQERYLKHDSCPVAAAMEKFGGKWKPIILYLISHGYNRFGEMLKRIDGISKTVLTAKLRELEEDGILHREVFAEVPPRVEYTLTDFGLTLRPVLLTICKWGLENVLEDKGDS